MTSRDVAGHRTLADQLRGWSDGRLAGLLAERPDLTTPAPHDFGHLASRATVRASLSRALDALTRLELFVLDALVVAGQTTPAELRSIIHADAAAVDAALDRLLDLALAWEPPAGAVRALSGAGDALAGGPSSGLRPRSTGAPDAGVVATRIAELSAEASALLAHVIDQGGEAVAGTARRTVSAADAASPAEELIARRLLVPLPGSERLVAPGEVGLVLRDGRTTTRPVDVVPPVAVATRSPDLVDRTAAGAAFEAVRRIELLLDHWGAEPPGVLRSGGLGVRDLRAAASHLSLDVPTTALLVETASVAGLLGARADATGASVWVPTDTFDDWTGEAPAERWARLARGWLGSPRLPGLVGSRDLAGKTWNALQAELSSVWMVETRRMTLDALGELGAGEGPAAGTGTASVVMRLEWRRPRRPASRAGQVAMVLTEAAVLGLTGLGALASYARTLVAGGDPAPGLEPLLPPPVDHVVIQADLTAVAPGPLESALARRLALVADVESRGGATTYRFTSGSVRRALDAGWTSVELHAFLGSVSRTPVPQPLTYLVDDTVRTFGTVRVGHAEAFLRADDESALAELLHHPRAGSLGLRRIAPTVLVSTTPLDVLLPRLRELGAAPVVEAADGSVQVTRRDQLRARPARDRRAAAATEARDTARVTAVVAAIRSGERAAASRPATPAARLSPSGSLAALREAIESGTTVVIGYVDNQGVSADRVVDPLLLEGGRLRARDHRVEDVREFAVHRITAVRPVS